MAAPLRLLGAASNLETCMVMIGRNGPLARFQVDRLVEALRAEIVPLTKSQSRRAVAALLRYGKRRPRGAGLNFGACWRYALAAESDLPLLFRATFSTVRYCRRVKPSDARRALVRSAGASEFSRSLDHRIQHRPIRVHFLLFAFICVKPFLSRYACGSATLIARTFLAGSHHEIRGHIPSARRLCYYQRQRGKP